jgi:hypothetical protein
MGFGGMKLTGPRLAGPPADRDAALAVLRRAVELGVQHIETSDHYGPHVVNQLVREAPTTPWPKRSTPPSSGRPSPARPAGTAPPRPAARYSPGSPATTPAAGTPPAATSARTAARTPTSGLRCQSLRKHTPRVQDQGQGPPSANGSPPAAGSFKHSAGAPPPPPPYRAGTAERCWSARRGGPGPVGQQEGSGRAKRGPARGQPSGVDPLTRVVTGCSPSPEPADAAPARGRSPEARQCRGTSARPPGHGTRRRCHRTGRRARGRRRGWGSGTPGSDRPDAVAEGSTGAPTRRS